MRLRRVTLKESTHPRYRWEIYWREGGKACRRWFHGREAARVEAELVESRLARMLETDTPLSAAEWAAVRECRAAGVPLPEAVRGWITGRRERQGHTVTAALAARLREVRRMGVTSKHLLRVVRVFRSVRDAMGRRPVASITEADAGRWVFGNSAAQSPDSLRARRAVAGSAFELARRRGWILQNVFSGLRTPRREAREEVRFLSPEEAGRYLAALQGHAPALLAVEAVQLFAGLRRAEAQRLEWSEVVLAGERPFIRVTAGKSKTRQRRLVDVEPALARILRPLAGSGRLQPRNARRLRERALVAAGWRGERGKNPEAPAFPANSLRHSYVTYHLAMWNDLARLELLAGHDRKVTFAHYRGLTTQEAARRFWELDLSPHPPSAATP